MCEIHVNVLKIFDAKFFEFSLKIDKIENKTNLKNRQNCKLDKIEK